MDALGAVSRFRLHFSVGSSLGQAKQITEIASIAKHNFFTLPFSFELELWLFIFADDNI